MRTRIICLLVVAIAASSCQKKPAGQSIAVVNNEEITASDLNAELASANVAPGDASKDVRAQALDRLIDRRLLAQQAKADGIDKSPEFLNQQRRATEDILINMLLGRQAGTQQVPSADEIAKFEASRPGMFAKRETWTLDQLRYPLPKDPAVQAKIAAAKTLDEVAQALTAAGVQYTKATGQLDTAVIPPSDYARLSNLGPNEPFIVPGPDRAVASVIVSRQAAPLSEDQQRQLALAQIKRERIDQLVRDRVKDLKAKAKIEYQPGFGPPKS